MTFKLKLKYRICEIITYRKSPYVELEGLHFQVNAKSNNGLITIIKTPSNCPVCRAELRMTVDKEQNSGFRYECRNHRR